MQSRLVPRTRQIGAEAEEEGRFRAPFGILYWYYSTVAKIGVAYYLPVPNAEVVRGKR